MILNHSHEIKNLKGKRGGGLFSVEMRELSIAQSPYTEGNLEDGQLYWEAK